MTAIAHPYLNVGGCVLAAVDRSAYTESVSRYAAWAALRLSAPLKYVHVLDRRPETASSADYSGSLEMDAQAKLLEGLASLDEKRSKLGQERGRLLLQLAKTTAERDQHHRRTAAATRHPGGHADQPRSRGASIRAGQARRARRFR